MHVPFGPAAVLWFGLAPDELDQGPSISVWSQSPRLILHQQLAHTSRQGEETERNKLAEHTARTASIQAHQQTRHRDIHLLQQGQWSCRASRLSGKRGTTPHMAVTAASKCPYAQFSRAAQYALSKSVHKTPRSQIKAVWVHQEHRGNTQQHAHITAGLTPRRARTRLGTELQMPHTGKRGREKQDLNANTHRYI